MFRRLSRRLTYANVMSTIAVFGVLGTGGAYAANTIGSTDIIDGQVNSADVKDQSLTTFDVSTFLGADVVDDTLTGADIADGSLRAADFTKQEFGVPLLVGTVNANTCKYISVGAPNVADESVIVTPAFASSSSFLMYDAEYRSTNLISIKVCNPTTSAIDDDTTVFRVLVIDSDG